MKKEIWLLLSGFGIMFAVLSWLQESAIITNAQNLGGNKGLYALASGLILYLIFRKNI
tara:strand:+ start:486 stop:659 length:174 start_codon:yes stop_codon:yes gene_type:complete